MEVKSPLSLQGRAQNKWMPCFWPDESPRKDFIQLGTVDLLYAHDQMCLNLHVCDAVLPNREMAYILVFSVSLS